jgi:serine protease Do
MNDQPPTGPFDPGRPDPDIDDTQRVDLPRYAPAPRPRPGSSWAAWSGSGQPQPQPTPERWFEPNPADSPPGAFPAGSEAGPVRQPGGSGGPAAPVPPRRRGPGMGTIFATSLLSAVLASGGTVLVLSGAGAFDRAAVPNTVTPAEPVGSRQPVSIEESSAVIDASARVSPAVVRITTQAAQNLDPFSEVPQTGVGSGVIYDGSGWIVTNRHVVAGTDRLTVELKDGREFQGRVYGIDTLTDLAIVKIDATGLPVAAIGESDGLKVGQLVIAIGSPLGTYSFSVTSGIVSGKGRTIQVDGGQRLSNLIQTDAAINPGNSGGPLVDAAGTIVGINTAIARDSNGIGFAIPVDIARPIMEQALRGEELARPWIGIRFESITRRLKDERQLTVDAGALVSSGSGQPAVVPDSPAEAAGIRDADIILSLDGIQIDAERPLDALIVQFAPGRTIQLEILRDGRLIVVPVTLGTRPADLQ